MKLIPPRRQPEVPTESIAGWDEASRCPECQEQMTTVMKQRAALKLTATVYTLECRNERCPWGENRERKVVQVNADGTIPVRRPGPKEFPGTNLTPEQQSRVDDMGRELLQWTIRRKDKPAGELEKPKEL